MDELRTFIESLREMTLINLGDYCSRFRELVENVEIHGAKKTFNENGASLHVGNICISIFDMEVMRLIEVIINNKYMRFSDLFVEFKIINKSLDSVLHYYGDRDTEYLDISDLYMYKVKDVEIDWLLSQKITKSARN